MIVIKNSRHLEIIKESEAQQEQPGLNVIDNFLEKWKEKATNTYTELKNEYDSIKNDREKRIKFLRELTKQSASIITYVGNFEKHLKDTLDEEVKRKKIHLIQRITKKAGNITNAEKLRLSNNGEINGTITGDKMIVNVKTIYAGGYNIQKLHYRVLVKEVK